MKSNVADIKNINPRIKAGCIAAASFLSYFIDNNIPWIHIDLGTVVYVNSTIISYGIYLLYEFIKNI